MNSKSPDSIHANQYTSRQVDRHPATQVVKCKVCRSDTPLNSDTYIGEQKLEADVQKAMRVKFFYLFECKKCRNAIGKTTNIASKY